MNKFYQIIKLKFLLLLSIFLVSGNTNAFWVVDSKGGGHGDITEQGVSNSFAVLSNDEIVWFSDASISNIAEWVEKPDKTPSMKGPIYHFDNEKFMESSKRLLDGKNELIEYLLKKESNGFLARYRLALHLHTLQDFYSHSTWVEQGNMGINTDLGVNLLIGLTPDAIGGVCNSPNINNVNLININTTITTGYYPKAGACDFNAIEPNKCAHGSLYYSLTIDEPIGCIGLNKDYDEKEGFTQAKLRAVVATTVYVNHVIAALEKAKNDLAICKLLGGGIGKWDNSNWDECSIWAP